MYLLLTFQMSNFKFLEVLAEMAITSEYFMQVTLDSKGDVLSSDSGLGPVPSLFEKSKKPIHFSDCFLSSDWIKYESHRQKAWNLHHQSFAVELQKINHPSGQLLPTKWEFFFVIDEPGTCIGLGHPLSPVQPYHIQLGDFIEHEESPTQIIDSLLEDRLLGFWEYSPQEKEASTLSSGIAQALGYSEAEIATAEKISWEKHIHPEDYFILAKELVLHFKNSGAIPFKKEFRLLTKGHQIIWAMAFGKPNEWAKDGSAQKVQGIIIDITEKKKQELWLKEHHLFLRDLAFHQSHTMRARVANILGLIDILSLESHSLESQNMLDLIKKETNQLDQALKKSIKESVQQHKIFEEDAKPPSPTDSKDS